MIRKQKFGAGSGLRNTQKEILACQFLIDTLPIRITPKSFIIGIDSHSNRHSSETCPA